MHWKIVIYNDAPPKAVNEKPYAVVTVAAGLSGLEESLDDEGVFADRR